eukprot:g10916.t1
MVLVEGPRVVPGRLEQSFPQARLSCGANSCSSMGVASPQVGTGPDTGQALRSSKPRPKWFGSNAPGSS